MGLVDHYTLVITGMRGFVINDLFDLCPFSHGSSDGGEGGGGGLGEPILWVSTPI